VSYKTWKRHKGNLVNHHHHRRRRHHHHVLYFMLAERSKTFWFDYDGFFSTHAMRKSCEQ